MFILMAIASVVAICGCLKCSSFLSSCRLRNCALVKHFLLCLGFDSNDDFELMVLAHEAGWSSESKFSQTMVKVTAGCHTVKTGVSPAQSGNGSSLFIWQQPLHITVEQGTEQVVVELLSESGVLLAMLKIPVSSILDEFNLQPERMYQMAQKGKGVKNPNIKLTMVVSGEDDAEKGLLIGEASSDVSILVRQQLKKVKMAHQSEEGVSEMDVLKDACAGPLELWEGLGDTKTVFVAAMGPPVTRKWTLGLWKDKKHYDDKKRPVQEISLTKIQSIQADPHRNHVFFVNFYDDRKVRQALTFRRMDRNRDVWVEILHLLVMKAREASKNDKRMKTQMISSDKSSFHGASTSLGSYHSGGRH